MNGDVVNVVYMVVALVVFGAAAFSAHRRAKAVGARGPGPMVSLLIWVAILALVAVLYSGVQVWQGLTSPFR